MNVRKNYGEQTGIMEVGIFLPQNHKGGTIK